MDALLSVRPPPPISTTHSEKVSQGLLQKSPFLDSPQLSAGLRQRALTPRDEARNSLDDVPLNNDPEPSSPEVQKARQGASRDEIVSTQIDQEVKKTLNWEEIDEWQRDNYYIRGHYRPASHSYYRSVLSYFYLHNEAVNMHTHLLGTALYLTLLTLDALSPWPTTPLLPFYVGAIICLTCSTLFHTISNHSLPLNTSALRLDFIGIITLTHGSFVPSLYYGFASHPDLRNQYCLMITALSAVCLYVSTQPAFRRPELKPLRGITFGMLGLSGLLPMFHAVWLFGWERSDVIMGMRALVLEMCLYATGAVVYASRVPERWYPGWFDIVGSSHQLFHCFVVGASLMHWGSLVKSREVFETGLQKMA